MKKQQQQQEQIDRLQRRISVLADDLYTTKNELNNFKEVISKDIQAVIKKLEKK